MTNSNFIKTTGVITAFVAIIAAGMVNSFETVRAHDDDDDEGEEAKMIEDFRSRRFPLDLLGKNRKLVGLGSYIVNAQSGLAMAAIRRAQQMNYAANGNPYFGQEQVVNVNHLPRWRQRLRSVSWAGPFPHIISRNLTPDKNWEA